MKSSKLNPIDRAERRERIMEKRAITLSQHQARGRSYVRSSTTKFDKRSSDRQHARYARQTGYVAPVAAVVEKPKVRRTRKIAG